MSIILKGIDMPKHDEGICVTIWKDGIVYARDIKTDTTIEAEAEAIQIPKGHGRLIDWDAFNNKLDIQYAEGRGKTLAPTILEKEGSR